MVLRAWLELADLPPREPFVFEREPAPGATTEEEVDEALPLALAPGLVLPAEPNWARCEAVVSLAGLLGVGKGYTESEKELESPLDSTHILYFCVGRKTGSVWHFMVTVEVRSGVSMPQ